MAVDIHDDPHDYTWRVRKEWPDGEHIEIFCEGHIDAALYNRLLGPTLGRWIRFSVVNPVGQNDDTSGALRARKRMQRIRRRRDRGKLTIPRDGKEPEDTGLFKAYCLLDGEEMARMGADSCSFPRAPIVIPAADVPVAIDTHGYRKFRAIDGILFLNCYELENLYLFKADLPEHMFRRWKPNRALFGTTIEVEDSWKILQRMLIVGEINRFALFHNIEHGVFREHVNNIVRHDGKLYDHLDNILTSLANPPDAYIPRHFRSSLSTIRGSIPALRQKIEKIMTPNAALFDLHDDLLMKCDGKSFFRRAIDGSEKYHDYFQHELFANGFGTVFQTALIAAIGGADAFGSGIVCEPENPDETDFYTSWNRGWSRRTERRRERRRRPSASTVDRKAGP